MCKIKSSTKRDILSQGLFRREFGSDQDVANICIPMYPRVDGLKMNFHDIVGNLNSCSCVMSSAINPNIFRIYSEIRDGFTALPF